MNNISKTIIVFAIVLILGLSIGYFGGRKYDGAEEFEKTIDSIQTVNAVKDEMLNSLIEKSNKKVKQHNSNIKKNEEHFEDNRDRVFTDEQLDSIVRSANDNLE